MTDLPTVKSIVIEYLVANGYDGLCTIDCGCWVERDDDPDPLAPCGTLPFECTPGHTYETCVAAVGDDEYDAGDTIIRPGRSDD